MEPYNTKDEAERAAPLKRQREARKAYSASQELGDETEAQVDAVYFAPMELQSSCDGDCWFEYEPSARYHRIKPAIRTDDDAQAKFLRDEGEIQERLERAFLWGALIGGAFALTVFVGTLMWAGMVGR